MASTSAARVSRTSGPAADDGARIANAASTLFSENQSFITEIRKSLVTMKNVAVDLEKENKTQMVKELEDAVLELLAASDDCARFSSVLQSIQTNYKPADELTDFKKLIEEGVAKLKTESPSVPQNNPFFRQFKEAVWDVHHAGQPMPGEEQEDIVMTSTQSNLLNAICPLTGKPITELQNPVRRCVFVWLTVKIAGFCSMDCKHIYEKQALRHYKPHRPNQCPVAGCSRPWDVARVVCDPLLEFEIDELRSKSNQRVDVNMVEDCTELDDD